MLCMVTVKLLLILKAVVPTVAILLLHVVHELGVWEGSGEVPAVGKEANWSSTRDQSQEHCLLCTIALTSLSR